MHVIVLFLTIFYVRFACGLIEKFYPIRSNRFFLCKSSANFEGYQQPRTKAGAYTIAAAANVSLPVIILVSPFLDQNVGSVARAMLNFGLYELRVVQPRCDILSEHAKSLASGALEILENAKVFATLQECIADLQIVMATTIRPRDMTQSIVSPTRAAQIVVNEDHIRSGILFGPERSGYHAIRIEFAIINPHVRRT